MQPSTVQQIIKIVRARGMDFAIKNGKAVLTGKTGNATPPLLKAVNEFRWQILDHLQLDPDKPMPAQEPDFSRAVMTMDGFGIVAMIINPEDWKAGKVAWHYSGEQAWRPIVGKEAEFPVTARRRAQT